MNENLDTMDLEDLRSHAEHLAGLAQYAKEKVYAMECRQMGLIRTAIDHETVCDAIYKELPQSMRW